MKQFIYLLVFATSAQSLYAQTCLDSNQYMKVATENGEKIELNYIGKSVPRYLSISRGRNSVELKTSEFKSTARIVKNGKMVYPLKDYPEMFKKGVDRNVEVSVENPQTSQASHRGQQQQEQQVQEQQQQQQQQQQEQVQQTQQQPTGRETTRKVLPPVRCDKSARYCDKALLKADLILEEMNLQKEDAACMKERLESFSK